MAGVAPGGAGGPPGDNPNPNPQPPQDAGDSDEDFTDEEEFEDNLLVSRRLQCPVCLRYVSRKTGLRRHKKKCVGPSDTPVTSLVSCQGAAAPT